MRRWLTVVALMGLLSGCSTVRGWFGGGESGPPPASLQPLQSKVTLKTVWTKQVGAGSGGQFVKLVPAVDGKHVYVAGRDGQVAAVDVSSGKTVWKTDTKARIAGGIGVGNGLVLVGTSDAGVIALKAGDGSQAWRTAVSSEVLGAPQARNGVVVAQTVDGNVVGLSADDGHQLWVYDRSVPVLSLRGTASPTIYQGNALVGFASGKLVALGMKNGSMLWDATVAQPTGPSELDRMVDVDSQPKVAGDVVYAVTYQGRVAAVSAANGQVIWAHKMSSWAGLGVDSNQLYVTDADSDVWSFDRLSGASVWKQDKLHNRTLTAPTPYGKYVAVGDFQGYLHLLSKADGSLVARIQLDEDGYLAPPVVAGDLLISYGEGGELAACRVSGG